MWTVYKHTSPSNKVYIGITSKTCQERWANGNRYKGNSIFSKSIKKYGWENISHEILYEGLTKKEAIEKEKELIKYYKELGLSYNITDGGEGQNGNHPSDEIKNKISKSLKGNIPWNKGIPMSSETKRKLSLSLKGKVRSEEFKRNLSTTNKGRKQSEETKKKISLKNKGRIHISHSQLGYKTIKIEELDKYLSEGWVKNLPSNICKTRSLYMSGRKWMNNGKIQKLVKSIDLNKYIEDGWYFGQLMNINRINMDELKSRNRKWMNKNGKNKMVDSIDIPEYIENGWILGRFLKYHIN